MSVPEPLAAYTDMLRADVTRANAVSWQGLYRNAQNHVESILADAKSTPQIEEACAAARDRCSEYAELLGERGLFPSAGNEIEQTRERALMAIRDLELRLEDATPSERAVMLGYGWLARPPG